MAFTPPSAKGKNDATFEELLRYSLQLDANSNFIGMTVLGANGTSLYPLPLTAAGSDVKVSLDGGNPVAGATGAVVPANAVQVGGSDGTNLQALRAKPWGTLPATGEVGTLDVHAMLVGQSGAGAWVVPTAQAPADAVSNALSVLHVLAETAGFNGTTSDRLRTSTVGTGVLQVSSDNSYSHISTNATTTVKSGAGILHTLVINTRGSGSTATVYDNTAGSGTVVAVIDTTLSTTSFIYDLKFSTGLTIVTAGTGAADITVTYR